MKLFLAVPVPEQVQHQVAMLGRLSPFDGPGETNEHVHVKYTPTTDLHITLNFLGDWREDKEVYIINRLRNNPLNLKPFEVRLRGMGRFLGPYVLWFGVDPELAVRQLYWEVSRVLEQSPRASFTPHVTWAKDIMDSQGQQFQMRNRLWFSLPWTVDHIILYSSSKGEYTPICSVPLGDPKQPNLPGVV